MRMSTIKFFCICALAVLTLAALIIFIPQVKSDSENASAAPESSAQEKTVNYSKIKTAEDRIGFLNSLGIEVEPDAKEEVEMKIPSEFDKVFAAYNEIQKRMGLDLSKYKNKNVTRYTYLVTNYDGYDEPVYANIIVYKNKVIGGDICSADPDGFVHGLEMTGDQRQSG